MAKVIREGSFVRVRTSANRIRQAVVTSVASQNSITARIGRTSFSATRAASTTTRGTLFVQV